MLSEPPVEAVRAIRALESDVDTAFGSAIQTLCFAPGHAEAHPDAAHAIGPREQAANFLRQSNIELNSIMSAIAIQLMWTPYAAFYGETNAGKSTLIEALRLYFGEKAADAGISIGDGRSDFTREATCYSFTFNDRAFTLVDVPGIEGKESVVEDTIRSALARAQVVFYITPDARPPQGGEGGREGTLEKLARQLKPHAKVWAIWNKKIHSPRALVKPLLVEGSDEWHSLHEGTNSLNAKMREVLDTRYQTCLPVSARPAFLALATHLASESKLARERARFLERIPEAQLLKTCGIYHVVDLIISEIPSAADIRHANFGKLTMPIRECADEIAKKARADFLTPAYELEAAIKKLKARLENIAGDTHSNLRRLSDELIQTTIARIRSQMMDAIQSGIDNDKDLKSKIESILKKEKIALEKRIRDFVQKTTFDTRLSLKDALEIMKIELAQEDTFSIPGFAANFDHTIEVDTASGVDWAGLGTAVVGGAVAAFLTGGWSLVFSIAGALFGAWNALASLFSSQYKKDQQKKALNNKLYLVRKELSLSVPKKMTEVSDDVAKFVRSQAHPFEQLCVYYRRSGQALLDVSRKLSKLSDPAALISAA